MDIKRTIQKNTKKTEIKTFIYTKGEGEGKGKGVPCSREDLDRIHKLCIPPNWNEVCISNSPISHLQVTGNDNKKIQYIYHPMWVVLTNYEKYRRMGKFSKKIDLFMEKINRDINSQCVRTRTLAMMFKILNLTHIRVGNECYAKNNNTYGLITLEKKHITFNGNITVILNFVGKKSVVQHIEFNDQHCAVFLKSVCSKITPNDRVFPGVSGGILNKYLQETIGDEFSCKDFRTYASNVLFLKYLCKLEYPNNSSEIKKNLISVYNTVASKLGHTRAISKKSYVMPIISEQYTVNPLQFVNKNPNKLFSKLIEC